jgi:NADH-quinone oxidoreductase subunit N
MNYSLITLEILAVLLGLTVLLADLWVSPSSRKALGLGLVAALGCLLAFAVGSLAPQSGSAFSGLFVVDDLARYFKGFFIFAALAVVVMAVDFAPKFGAGLSEFFALTVFALVGMLFAASANDLVLLFVSLELITVTFFVLNSFQRTRLASLEAGVKYLILGGVSSAFMVFGIALIFGTANSTNFSVLFAKQKELSQSALFLMGLLLVLVGLGFKMAAVPFQMWAPDVYQGSPAPATAFLAVGSKAAGFVLLIRLLVGTVPQITAEWHRLFVVMSGATILFGSLCAIPQRNLKRLMGYSSIANAGYLLLGIVAGSAAGSTAILYYLGGYAFTVLAAFTVISAIANHVESDDISALSGLGQRSPFLAAVLTMAIVSLAGIPPMAGFFGKVLLLKSVLDAAAGHPELYALIAVAVVGVVISLYYYFGVIRAIYWGGQSSNLSTIPVSLATRVVLVACVAGILVLGIFPQGLLKIADQAVAGLSHSSTPAAHKAAH